jgi:hypothetical protein
MEDYAPHGLAGYCGNTLRDDLRMPARGREDFIRLKCPRGDAQPGKTGKSHDENERNQRPPASSSSHHIVPGALT